MCYNGFMLETYSLLITLYLDLRAQCLLIWEVLETTELWNALSSDISCKGSAKPSK